MREEIRIGDRRLNEIARRLAELHKESLYDWEARTVKACEERGWGTRAGPNDNPKQAPRV